MSSASPSSATKERSGGECPCPHVAFLEGHLHSDSPRNYRDYRCCKLYSATMILSAINMQATPVKIYPSTLALVAGLVYLINALHSCPDDDSAGRTIQKTIFPLTQSMNHPNILVRNRDLNRVVHTYPNGFPYALAGSLFMADFFLRPEFEYYKFRDPRTLPIEAYQQIFGCPLAQIGLRFFQRGVANQVKQAIAYVKQRKGETIVRRPRPDDEVLPQFTQFSNVDVPMDVDNPGQEDVQTIAEQLDKIWQQFASDIFQKIGNPSQKPGAVSPVLSYCPLTQYDRQQLTIDNINTLDLNELFTQVQWRRGSEAEWEKSFRIMFPPWGYVPGSSTKHLLGCHYYNKWVELLQNFDELQAIDICDAVRRKFRTLAWVPAALCDRLWDYSKADRSFVPVPHHITCGPRIYINPWVGGEVSLNAETEEVRIEALRQEEEESSEGEPEGNAVSNRPTTQRTRPSTGNPPSGLRPTSRNPFDAPPPVPRNPPTAPRTTPRTTPLDTSRRGVRRNPPTATRHFFNNNRDLNQFVVPRNPLTTTRPLAPTAPTASRNPFDAPTPVPRNPPTAPRTTPMNPFDRSRQSTPFGTRRRAPSRNPLTTARPLAPTAPTASRNPFDTPTPVPRSPPTAPRTTPMNPFDRSRQSTPFGTRRRAPRRNPLTTARPLAPTAPTTITSNAPTPASTSLTTTTRITTTTNATPTNAGGTQADDGSWEDFYV